MKNILSFLSALQENNNKEWMSIEMLQEWIENNKERIHNANVDLAQATPTCV